MAPIIKKKLNLTNIAMYLTKMMYFLKVPLMCNEVVMTSSNSYFYTTHLFAKISIHENEKEEALHLFRFKINKFLVEQLMIYSVYVIMRGQSFSKLIDHYRMLPYLLKYFPNFLITNTKFLENSLWLSKNSSITNKYNS